jgi:SAM-dependent methyltransferase
MNQQLIIGDQLDLAALKMLSQKPALFEGGTVEFWKDPYIAQQMLATHLNPNTEAASRPPAVIDQIVAWIVDHLHLKPGDTLLDLGCGPGLYCQRFVSRGLTVTGVDFSQNSLNYAREHDTDSTYICQDYRSLDVQGAFDAITLIFGDFCVLSDWARAELLEKAHRLLVPGGHFVLDVSTRAHHENTQPAGTSWYMSGAGGFWKPGPHLVLEQNLWYPEDDVALEQNIVIEEDGTMSLYRNWFHYYSPETITEVLESHGFTVTTVNGGLTGVPYTPETWWLGVVAQRK